MEIVINKICLLVLLSIFNATAYSAEKINVVQDKKIAFDTIKGLSSDYSFAMVNKTELPSGTRYKLVEMYKELLVWNTRVISKKILLEDMKEDDLIAGEFFIKLETDLPSTVPTLSRDDIVEIATSENKNSNIKNINTQLSIKSYAQIAKLVYLVDYFIDESLPRRPFYIIAADSGEILEFWEGLPT